MGHQVRERERIALEKVTRAVSDDAKVSKDVLNLPDCDDPFC